ANFPPLKTLRRGRRNKQARRLRSPEKRPLGRITIFERTLNTYCRSTKCDHVWQSIRAPRRSESGASTEAIAAEVRARVRRSRPRLGLVAQRPLFDAASWMDRIVGIETEYGCLVGDEGL